MHVKIFKDRHDSSKVCLAIGNFEFPRSAAIFQDDRPWRCPSSCFSSLRSRFGGYFQILDGYCWHPDGYWRIISASWWRHQMGTFSALLAICAGNSPVPGDSPHKGQWRGALMFSLNCVWIHGWVNTREAGDLRRYRAHYDVTVMSEYYHSGSCSTWHWGEQVTR